MVGGGDTSPCTLGRIAHSSAEVLLMGRAGLHIRMLSNVQRSAVGVTLWGILAIWVVGSPGGSRASLAYLPGRQVDLGPVMAGTNEFSVTIRNDGSTARELQRVSGTCGCTKVLRQSAM